MTRAAVAEAATQLNDRFDLPERFDPAIPLSNLVENGHNARRKFDPIKLNELAESMKSKGVVEPLVVRPTAGGAVDDLAASYEIVAGARRVRAARLAGRTHVPCVIREYSDSDVLEIQLIENIQREELDPLEEANGYKMLIESNKAKYSVAYIADRIGRDEKYVWDTLRLLNLVPAAVEHLEAGRISRRHAVALARLKPATQRQVIDPMGGGLFVPDTSRLAFDPQASASDKYAGLKAVSARELEHYIADHVRFDLEHMATTAPLEFGSVAQAVEAAKAKPGRGKKVISVHYGSHLAPSAKDEKDRTFGLGSWKRADGTDNSKRCDHAVLGVVVAGEGYGQALGVCIAKEACDVHWKKERADRERTRELRSSGKTEQANAREEKLRKERQAEEARYRAEREAFAESRDAILEQLAQALKKAKVGTVAPLVLEACDRTYKGLGKKSVQKLMGTPKGADAVLRAAALSHLAGYVLTYERPTNELTVAAKALGVDVTKIFKAAVSAKLAAVKKPN